MNSIRSKLSNRKLMQNGFIHLQSYSSSTTTSNIQIPNRKERGPTDILMALESTIRRDPTAPHYKYIDDPYLIPVSSSDKRSYALSKEAGRKAAMWIRQEHSEFFDHKVADPFIESYAPRAVYTEESKVSEEILLNNIKSGNVADSLTIYNLLKGNVTIETKLALFELLCFYNSINPINEELIEERWFSLSGQDDKNRTTWKECTNKHELFKCLTAEKGEIEVAAYNAIITGLIKHRSFVKGWDLYEECTENNIPMNKRTYDHLIRAILVAKEQDSDRLLILQDIYKTMMEKNLRPDVQTLNSSLQLLSVLKMIQKKNTALMIINEFKSIDVKPGLAAYYYLLRCFANDNDLLEKALTEIMDIVENEKLEFQVPEDKLFFCHAMQSAYYSHSLILGKRVHDLLLKQNNYTFLKDCYQENIYYRYYLLLHLKVLSFESFMQVYDEMTPNIYTPEQSVFKEILFAMVEAKPDNWSEILPMLCSQTISYDFLRSDEIVILLLSMMTDHFKPESDSPLNKTYATHAWTIWTESQELKLKSRRGYTYAADILERIAVLCLRGGEFDQMLEVLSTLVKNQNLVVGAMTSYAMREIFDACLVRGHSEAALSLIEYAIEYGMDEGTTMGFKAHKVLALSGAQEIRLKALVGKDLEKMEVSSEQS